MTDSARKGAILVLVLLALVFTLFMRERQRRNVSDTSMLEMWAETEDPNAPILLEFGAHGCLPCNQMIPVLKDLRTEYPRSLRVLFINMDDPENQEATEMHTIRVKPTQIFKDPNGTELFRHEGYFSKSEIVEKWQELGYSLQDQ